MVVIISKMIELRNIKQQNNPVNASKLFPNSLRIIILLGMYTKWSLFVKDLETLRNSVYLTLNKPAKRFH